MRSTSRGATHGERDGNRISAIAAGRRGPFLEGRFSPDSKMLPLQERAERERSRSRRPGIDLAVLKAGAQSILKPSLPRLTAPVAVPGPVRPFDPSMISGTAAVDRVR